MSGRDGTKGISGRRNSMHQGGEAWTSKTHRRGWRYPISLARPSGALRGQFYPVLWSSSLQRGTSHSCPSVRDCLPPPPLATRLHCSSSKDLEAPRPCGHRQRGTHSRSPNAWADPSSASHSACTGAGSRLPSGSRKAWTRPPPPRSQWPSPEPCMQLELSVG